MVCFLVNKENIKKANILVLVKNLNHNTSPFYTGRVAAMYDMKDQTDACK